LHLLFVAKHYYETLYLYMTLCQIYYIVIFAYYYYYYYYYYCCYFCTLLYLCY